jgi:tetratricopeptide (TPR) repeat protein
VILLGLAACATARRGPADRFRQVDHGLPAATEFPVGPERDAYAAAQAHEAKGDATASGNLEQARGEWATAATGYAAAAEGPGASEWRVPLRCRAAELLLRAQRWDKGAEIAEALAADPHANDASKAIAARLAATARVGAANALVKSGQLERLDLGSGARKDGARPPPEPWKRVVGAIDAYLARASADPEARKPPGGRRPGVSPPELALVAAEVHVAYGELEQARVRLEALIDRWPQDGETLEQAVPLFLATFLAREDRAGHDAAVDRLRERLSAEAARATVPKEKVAFSRVLEGLGRARAGARFGSAERLLAQGKPAEAAQAFEAVAHDPGVGDPASALHNAAVAWDKANELAKAAEVRERIVKNHSGSPVAADDALALAAHRARTGDHAAAARVYEDFLQRWPQSPNRCVALRNVATELDVAGRACEAASRYLAFGQDDACAKTDPNIAARALVRAGRLFEAQARGAYAAAIGLPGVAEPDAKKQVSEAKRRVKAL